MVKYIMEHNVKYHGLKFTTSINKWDEAIPLGNGKMGALLWGDGYPLRLSLDRHDLWDERSAEQTLSPDFKYRELVNIVKKGEDYYHLHNEMFDDCYSNVTPTKIPAGRIEIYFDSATDNIKSNLDLKTAISFIKVDEKVCVEAFMHATEFIGVIKITGANNHMAVKLRSPEFNSSTNNEKSSGNELFKLGYAQALHGTSGNSIYFLQKTADDLEYAIVLTQKRIKDTIFIIYDIATNRDSENWIDDTIKKLEDIIEKPFLKLEQSHIDWWKEFWEKSEIIIPDKNLEKQYYLANYFLGSCSRKQFSPMPLQGVWTADNQSLPPWKGDYHHDLNTQMSYWSYMKANHMEEGESFVEFLWNLEPKARKFAKEFFETDGILMPAVSTLNGNVLGGWPQYSINIVNQIWLCQAFDHFYKYTGNVKFLKEKAYPYFKESAKAVISWLSEDENGKLRLPLSSSPEVYDNTYKSYQIPNTNNDLALLHYLFKTLQEYSEILENGESQVWENFRDKLEDIAVSDNGIMMSKTELLPESHRHLGHLMCFYPLHLMNYETENNKKLLDNSLQYLEVLGTGLWVGFTFTWMSSLYAKQQNGEAAWYQLKLFEENFVSMNGFHLNGDYMKRGISFFHYRPFTLEGNFGFANALQEMLLQNHENIINLFPAIPKHWRTEGVKFKNLRSYYGVLVSSSIVDGFIEYCTLFSEREIMQKVFNKFNSSTLYITHSGEQHVVLCEIGDVISIKFNGLCEIKTGLQGGGILC